MLHVIVKEKRPKVVFMENVKNLAKHDGKTLEVIQATMEELGYEFNQKVLSSVNYGMPQKRERIYMVCFRKDIVNANFNFKYPKSIPLTKHVEDFLIPEEEIPKNLFVTREDTYMENKTDNVYSNKPIRIGIVNNGGKENGSIVQKVSLLHCPPMVVEHFLKLGDI